MSVIDELQKIGDPQLRSQLRDWPRRKQNLQGEELNAAVNDLIEREKIRKFENLRQLRERAKEAGWMAPTQEAPGENEFSLKQKAAQYPTDLVTGAVDLPFELLHSAAQLGRKAWEKGGDAKFKADLLNLGVTQGSPQWEKALEAREEGNKASRENWDERLLSSTPIRDLIDTATKGYTKRPQNDLIGEGLDYVGGFLLGGGAANKALLKNVAKASGVFATTKAVEGLTEDPLKGGAAGVGAAFLFSTINPKGAARAVSNSWNKALDMAGKSRKQMAITPVLNNLKKTIPKPALEGLGAAGDTVKKNLDYLKTAKRMPLKEALDFEAALMDAKRELFKRGKRDKEVVDLIKFEKVFQAEIQRQFKTKAPEVLKSYNLAKEGTRVLSKSEAMSNFFEKLTGNRSFFKGKEGFASLGGGLAFLGLNKFMPILRPFALTGIPLYKTAKTLYQVANSKVLRDHYTKLIKAAAEGNQAAALAALKKIGKEMQEEEEDQDNYTLVK